MPPTYPPRPRTATAPTPVRTVTARTVTARTAAARSVAAAVVLIALAGCSSDPTPTDPASATDTAAPDLTSAPAQVSWRPIAGVSVPVSVIDGPHGLDGNTAGSTYSGYSKTPQGAVLAAINGQTALATATDRAWPDVVNIVTAPGPGRDEFAAARTAVSVTGSVPADKAPSFVGFEVTDYRPDPLTAAVSVAQTIGPDHRIYTYPVALQWIDDDWRIVLPTAAENIDAAELTSLDGYTPLEHT